MSRIDKTYYNAFQKVLETLEKKDDIIVENQEGVLIVTLNRPTKANGLTLPMYTRLYKIFTV
jgi:enoyl-CoA hydratase/carnithine racemase